MGVPSTVFASLRFGALFVQIAHRQPGAWRLVAVIASRSWVPLLEEDFVSVGPGQGARKLSLIGGRLEGGAGRSSAPLVLRVKKGRGAAHLCGETGCTRDHRGSGGGCNLCASRRGG